MDVRVDREIVARVVQRDRRHLVGEHRLESRVEFPALVLLRRLPGFRQQRIHLPVAPPGEVEPFVCESRMTEVVAIRITSGTVPAEYGRGELPAGPLGAALAD